MGGRSITRREFTRRSILALAGAGAAGVIGYSTFNTKKIRAVNNLARMGHCAPAIMKTLLEQNDIVNDNMVLYAAGLAGGIAGSRTECGALTSPLMFLSFSNGNLSDINGKLDLISKAQSYVKEFIEFNGSPFCINIRQKGMPACRRAIYNHNQPFSKALARPVTLSEESEGSYTFLLREFEENDFHCAHNVLRNLEPEFVVSKELLDASWIFIGGLAMLNRTCGALTAGVMALSSATAKIEDSHSRVVKMNRLLRNGDNKAMDESINNFNRSINLSDELGLWFRNEFGFTSCYDIWKYDFSKMRDAESFIAGQCMEQCSGIGEKVAAKVNSMLKIG